MSERGDQPAQPLFSRRFATLDTRASRLADEIERLRASGRTPLDLTSANPTAVGLPCPLESIRESLAAGMDVTYEPDPFGRPEARSAIADYYGVRGSAVDPDRILITASTSEAYSLLFRLLTDPGDSVLVGVPSYPLFDFLAMAENLSVTSYPIHDSEGWHIDLKALDAAVTPTTRAIVVVHPNNPTGHYLKADEWSAVQSTAGRHGLAVIADEVFFDFPHSNETRPLDLLGETPALTFFLNGLSKTAGLPQLKLSWLVASGPPSAVSSAMERLEILSDTFLSVATPVQRALPRLLEIAPRIRGQILLRIRDNHRRLEASSLECLPVEGGWSAPIRMPATRSGEEWALGWLRDHDVLAHPGELFGFASPHVVVSLLTPPEVVEEALARVAVEGLG